MRPTARVRHNPVIRTAAKICRQYLKWFGNASYKPARNGERWVLESLRTESIHTVLDVGANVGIWSLMAAELLPQATIYALEVVPNTAATLRVRVGGHDRIRPFSLGLAAEPGRCLCSTMRSRALTPRSLTIPTAGPETRSTARSCRATSF